MVKSNIAISEEDGVVRAVVALGEATGIEGGKLLHLLAGSQNVMSQRMAPEDEVLELITLPSLREVVSDVS